MKLDEINNDGRVPNRDMCTFWPLCHLWAAPGLVGAVHGCDPVILDHGAPRSGKLVMLAIGASAPLIRGPGIQGPHHREGRESRDPITVGVRIHGGAGSMPSGTGAAGPGRFWEAQWPTFQCESR